MPITYPTKVKNCGLKDDISVTQAVKTGASFVGFIHHEPSPRHLPLDRIAPLIKRVPKTAKTVIVMADPSDQTLRALPKSDLIQIHNVNDPARIRAIADLTRTPIITAIRVRAKEDLANALELERYSAHLLFDAYHHVEAGGTGESFDWGLLAFIKPTKPWFLAGGLTVANVAQAIRDTGAPMVDVSSGIEWAKGIKSPEMIAAFNKAVLGN